MSLLQKTLNAYKKHGTIIIGVDFDDTIFPWNEETTKRCCKIRRLLVKIKKKYKITLCLFSVANKESLVYKAYIMKQWGLEPDFINMSPVQKWGDCTKPYFNIYIDDKSGIKEMTKLLTKLYLYKT
jgi:hypothetical protein